MRSDRGAGSQGDQARQILQLPPVLVVPLVLIVVVVEPVVRVEELAILGHPVHQTRRVLGLLVALSFEPATALVDEHLHQPAGIADEAHRDPVGRRDPREQVSHDATPASSASCWPIARADSRLLVTVASSRPLLSWHHRLHAALLAHSSRTGREPAHSEHLAHTVPRGVPGAAAGSVRCEPRLHVA